MKSLISPNLFYRALGLFASTIVAACWVISTPQATDASPIGNHIDGRCLPYEPLVVTLLGQLTLRTVYGPPGFGEDPDHDEKGQVPILTLDAPACVDGAKGGDENIPEVNVTELQVVHMRPLPKNLLGAHVAIRGSLFHSHTLYHHTTVLVQVDDPAEAITLASSSAGDEGRIVVASFYRSLEGRDGNTATMFVILDKRATGPLSANALTKFYSSLREPLQLSDIQTLSAQIYVAHYGYTTANGTICQGIATLHVTYGAAGPLIEKIQANC